MNQQLSPPFVKEQAGIAFLCGIGECGALSVHRHEELLVVETFDESVADGVHGLDGVHFGNELADNPHAVECHGVLQQVVAAG